MKTIEHLWEGMQNLVGFKDSDRSLKDVDQSSWTYEQFKAYLVQLLKGPNSLLPLKDYPSRIRLNGDWTSVLDRIRTDSQDGLERWALIGYKADRRSILLQTVLVLVFLIAFLPK